MVAMTPDQVNEQYCSECGSIDVQYIYVTVSNGTVVRCGGHWEVRVW
jgi:hypothetical protein